jgi:hypothetical protein
MRLHCWLLLFSTLKPDVDVPRGVPRVRSFGQRVRRANKILHYPRAVENSQWRKSLPCVVMCVGGAWEELPRAFKQQPLGHRPTVQVDVTIDE